MMFSVGVGVEYPCYLETRSMSTRLIYTTHNTQLTISCFFRHNSQARSRRVILNRQFRPSSVDQISSGSTQVRSAEMETVCAYAVTSLANAYTVFYPATLFHLVRLVQTHIPEIAFETYDLFPDIRQSFQTFRRGSFGRYSLFEVFYRSAPL